MRLLVQALRSTAAAPTILVASDYDGTLAPIVNNPDRAFPDRRALAALTSLAAMPSTAVAIISGRSADVLRSLTHAPPGIELVGSHGAELGRSAPSVSAGIRAELASVRERLTALAARFPGSRIEEKPAGLAYHYREVATELRAAADAEARSIAEDHPTLGLLTGKRVVEFAGTDSNKGSALLALRDGCRADVVVFIGDDVTDEDAFLALGPQDVGIKVGRGPTRARFWVDEQSQVATVLETLEGSRDAYRQSGAG